MINGIKVKLILQAIICTLNLFGQGSIIDSINSTDYQEIVSNLQKYEIIFQNNLNAARKINYEKGIAKSLSNLALVHYLKGDYEESTQFHIEAINIFEKLEMIPELSEEYGELGYQMKRMNLPKANEYMQKAISIAETNNIPSFRMSKLYDNYGVIKEMMEQYDSAFHFYRKALKIKEELNDSIGIPYSLNKISVLYAKLKRFDRAYEYLLLSDKLRAKEKGDFGRVENLSLHADFLEMQNKVDEAIKKYEEVYNAANKINYTYLVLYSLQKLSELYKKKNDFQNALIKSHMYYGLKDSVDNVEIKSRIAHLEIAYQTEQKNKLLAESQYQLKSREQQLLFALVTVILLILIFIGIYKYQSLKKKRDLAEVEYKGKLQSAILEKQLVAEKLKLSRELHDNIGSQLTFIISSLDNLIYRLKESELTDAISTVKNFSRNALTDLRNTIWAIKQQDGTVEDLSIRVTELISKLSDTIPNKKFDIENQIRNNIKLNSTQMLNLYRIIQESIQNSVKYSECNSIKIIFFTDEDSFRLIIKDDGKGFDIENTNIGNGIENMCRRCEESGGKFELKSSQFGTEIICEFEHPEI
ncbi:MAG: tetratricopeptide repeat protein [Ignavibacterium album]|uniref:tetratricopeptide repeat-containing sensor histidine kinase n=1 Tax=Ignavibacterium album TaxID=591197 RepID=UPI0026E98447|nr:tetratricopeptide repeat protein [Ignavibacterium album]MCX8105682.1 tetratricopeptide repeat protein [Ignavibacterium album]